MNIHTLNDTRKKGANRGGRKKTIPTPKKTGVYTLNDYRLSDNKVLGHSKDKGGDKDFQPAESDEDDDISNAEISKEELAGEVEDLHDDDEMGGPRLGNPDMEEDHISDDDVQEEFDEGGTGDLVRTKGGITKEQQEASVKADVQLKEIRQRFRTKMESDLRRHKLDAWEDRNKMDEDLEGVLDWKRDDAGASYHLIADPNGAYVRDREGDWRLAEGGNGKETLVQVGETNEDGSFRVKLKGREAVTEDDDSESSEEDDEMEAEGEAA